MQYETCDSNRLLYSHISSISMQNFIFSKLLVRMMTYLLNWNYVLLFLCEIFSSVLMFILDALAINCRNGNYFCRIVRSFILCLVRIDRTSDFGFHAAMTNWLLILNTDSRKRVFTARVISRNLQWGQWLSNNTRLNFMK